ncbi:hypothetical protein HD553DRAFT_53460 [Filobasidium floriforme]|uniref:uncharacterized protein n=1 Tax=Filobasidium floriforme TaxID=5210 RepID=UPI001E8CC26C|nr:uncharacterized protein HD553DRAFT_53460 [Filobasidium floriforme]KAH8083070.1 hypothetical protein HD553DRAFT_53460 [Filobasidium floriforme]
MDPEPRPKRRWSTSPDRPDKRIRLSPSSATSLSTSISATSSTSTSIPSEHTELAARSAVFNSAEIFLLILSFLPVDELINVERVCRYWRRMGEDGSLWKKMYLERFPYPSMHHLRAHTHGRTRIPNEISLLATPLPLTPRSTPPARRSSDTGSVDWKTLMRIGTNWSTGNAVTHSLSPSPSPSVMSRRGQRQGEEDGDDLPGPSRRRTTLRSTETVSPTLARRTVVPSADASPYPVHPPGFPLPPVSSGDVGMTYNPRLGPLRTRIPHPPPRPRQEPHTQALVPKQLLCLAGSFVLVAYPNSPLLHVHDSRPLQTNPVASGSGPNPNNSIMTQLSRTKDTATTTITPSTMTTMNRPIALIPPPPGWSSPSRPDYITAMATDESESGDTDDLRLVLFYRSGGFVILTLHQPDLHVNHVEDADGIEDVERAPGKIWNRSVVHVPAANKRNRKRHYIPPPEERVVLVGLRGRVVVGVTGGFYISIYETGDGVEHGQSGSARLVKVIHSAVASWPASLNLDGGDEDEDQHWEHDDYDEEDERSKRKSSTCVIRLGYSSPIYPRSWKPSIQEIRVRLSVSIPTTTSLTRTEPLTSSWTPLPEIDLPDPIELVRPSSSSKNQREPYVGVKTRPGALARVLALDKGWCVLAGKDDLVEVYRVGHSITPNKIPTRTQSKNGYENSSGSRITRKDTPKTNTASRSPVIEHSQTLLGHGSGIRSVALRDGRCVISGEDGRVLVWSLDRGATVQPADADPDAEDEDEDDEDYSERDGRRRKDGVVEIKEGRRRIKAQAEEGQADHSSGQDGWKRQILPVPPVTHPLSLVSAARELMLASPTSSSSAGGGPEKGKVKDLAFNEDTIVGLMLDDNEGTEGEDGDAKGGAGEGVVRVWKFDA